MTYTIDVYRNPIRWMFLAGRIFRFEENILQGTAYPSIRNRILFLLISNRMFAMLKGASNNRLIKKIPMLMSTHYRSFISLIDSY